MVCSWSAKGQTNAVPSSVGSNASTNAATAATPAPNASFDPVNLAEFDSLRPGIKKLLQDALALTKMNLTYTYGSADPAKGGMDCSGTIFYLLTKEGVPNVPRQANTQYKWVRERHLFQAVLSNNPDTFELNELKPGDLLFWTGTYDIDRDPPVTHAMIYLGTDKRNGHRLMVGASDGRAYEGKARNGVSIFDFHMAGAANPKQASQTSRFVGYGPIPDLPEPAPASVPAPALVPPDTSPR